MRQREGKDSYYLNIAEAVLACSTCLRRKYGAVIVRDDEIISTGYNGSPRGAGNCIDLGYCYRKQMQVPHGEKQELCQAVHAEANAVISASRRDMIEATLYLAGQEANGIPIAETAPCAMCYRLILNAGISTIVTRNIDGMITRKACHPYEVYNLEQV
ncbi:MAG: cytidine deaminase [Synergistaceae bacterium]|nr:cytidine deaminase [Synergistaceae bacterium]